MFAPALPYIDKLPIIQVRPYDVAALRRKMTTATAKIVGLADRVIVHVYDDAAEAYKAIAEKRAHVALVDLEQNCRLAGIAVGENEDDDAKFDRWTAGLDARITHTTFNNASRVYAPGNLGLHDDNDGMGGKYIIELVRLNSATLFTDTTSTALYNQTRKQPDERLEILAEQIAKREARLRSVPLGYSIVFDCDVIHAAPANIVPSKARLRGPHLPKRNQVFHGRVRSWKIC